MRKIKHLFQIAFIRLRLSTSLRRAKRLKRRNALTDSKHQIRKILSCFPYHVPALQILADIHVIEGRTQEASKISLNLLAEHPLDLTSIRRLQSVGHRVSTSGYTAFQYLERHGRSPKTLLTAARYLKEVHEFSAAAYQIYEALNFSSIPGKLYATLLYEGATCLAADRKYVEAIALLERMPPLARMSVRVSAERARYLIELGHHAEARRFIRRRVFYMRGDRRSLMLRQWFYFLNNDIRAAHFQYRRSALSKKLNRFFRQKQKQMRYFNIIDEHNLSRNALIVSSFGPGDEIRYASMYEEISYLFNKVIVSCEPRLQTLLARSFPKLEFLPTKRFRKHFPCTDQSDRKTISDQELANIVSDEVCCVGWSADIILRDVDVLCDLRRNRKDFCKGARLIVDPTRASQWSEEKSRVSNATWNIGVCWRSLLYTSGRQRHYLNVHDIKSLEKCEGIKFWICQAGITSEEREALLSFKIDVVFPDVDLVNDFEEQAALLSVLDAFVGPLSTMGELAGMVGTKPLLFARTHTASWRRNPDGSDVWYPDGKLLIGDPIWDRDALMKEVVRELQALKK